MDDEIAALRERLAGAHELIERLQAQVRVEQGLRADADAEIRRHHLDFPRWEAGWAEGVALQARVRVVQSELFESLPFSFLRPEQQEYRRREMREALAAGLASSEHVKFEVLEGPSGYGCRLRMSVELLTPVVDGPDALLVEPSSVAAGTVAVGLVAALRALGDEYGLAGVASTAAELVTGEEG